jgi:hypothetical protein
MLLKLSPLDSSKGYNPDDSSTKAGYSFSYNHLVHFMFSEKFVESTSSSVPVVSRAGVLLRGVICPSFYNKEEERS